MEKGQTRVVGYGDGYKVQRYQDTNVIMEIDSGFFSSSAKGQIMTIWVDLSASGTEPDETFYLPVFQYKSLEEAKSAADRFNEAEPVYVSKKHIIEQ